MKRVIAATGALALVALGLSAVRDGATTSTAEAPPTRGSLASECTWTGDAWHAYAAEYQVEVHAAEEEARSTLRLELAVGAEQPSARGNESRPLTLVVTSASATEGEAANRAQRLEGSVATFDLRRDCVLSGVWVRAPDDGGEQILLGLLAELSFTNRPESAWVVVEPAGPIQTRASYSRLDDRTIRRRRRGSASMGQGAAGIRTETEGQADVVLSEERAWIESFQGDSVHRATIGGTITTVTSRLRLTHAGPRHAPPRMDGRYSGLAEQVAARELEVAPIEVASVEELLSLYGDDPIESVRAVRQLAPQLVDREELLRSIADEMRLAHASAPERVALLALTLRLVGTPSAQRLLGEVIADGAAPLSSRQRAATALMLVAQPTEASVDTLVRACGDPDVGPVATVALAGLAREQRGSEGVGRLAVDAATSEIERLFEQARPTLALEAAGNLGGYETRVLSDGYLSNEDPVVREAAVRSLRHSRDAAVLAGLAHSLTVEDDPRVQRAIILRFLSEMERDRSIPPALVEDLRAAGPRLSRELAQAYATLLRRIEADPRQR